MRHSTNTRFTGSSLFELSVRDPKGFRYLLSNLFASCLVVFFGQNAISQTPAAPVQSVLTDTAMQTADEQAPPRVKAERTYMALASGVTPAVNSSSGDVLHLGDSDEGTIIRITEGEDRIIDEVPGGNLTSTYMDMNQYASPEYSQIPSSYAGGGAYTGHAAAYGPSMGNACAPANCNSYYLGYEAVFMKRQADEKFTLSRGNYLGEFDLEYGHRITIGQMLDCTDGVEFVYTGPFTWTRGRVDQSNSGSLDSIFSASGGYLASQIDTFNGAIRHIQVEQTKLQSYEANRRWFAEDVVSTLIGFRAIQVDESFLFDSVAPDLGAGFFRLSTQNLLLGGQIGADIYRPLGQRLSFGSKTRVGFFGNFHEGETVLANRGTYLLYARDKTITGAALIQLASSARYRILPHLVAVGGAEALILSRIGTASDQRYGSINPSTGLSYRTDDTVFFYGVTGGFEFTW